MCNVFTQVSVDRVPWNLPQFCNSIMANGQRR